MTLNKRKSKDKLPTKSRILLYQTEDGRQRIEVRLEDGTVWLSQKLMAELFQVGVNTINYHVKDVYKEGKTGQANFLAAGRSGNHC